MPALPSDPRKRPSSHRRSRYAGTHPKRFDQRYKELDPAAYPEMQEHVLAQGRTPAGTHVPVLLGEVMAALRPAPGDIVADCTLGYGGHAVEFLRRIEPDGRLIGLDVDAAQLERTRVRLAQQESDAGDPAASPLEANVDDAATPAPGGNSPRVSLHRSHFAGLSKVLAREGLTGCDVILADLGVSSMQIDDPARGFSYKYDGPLDMRMDDRLPHTAADLLAKLSAQKLAAGLAELADEPDAERIAAAVAAQRVAEPIKRTRQLVKLVFQAKGLSMRQWREREANDRQLHPAARTFQAVRMLVNDEIGGLEQFLRIAPYCLRPGGRIGIISFHSGEDSRVDAAFQAGLADGTYAAAAPAPIRPTGKEIAANPRSRSALFRWAVRAGESQSQVPNPADR